MTAPLPPDPVRPWYSCTGSPCTCRPEPKAEPTPDPAATAEQTVVDLLALLAVYEKKPIAYQWIRPSVIRSIIESGGAA